MDRLVQAKALGVEDALGDNEEMPGEINIKGDETHYHNYPAAPAQPIIQPTTPTTVQQPMTQQPQQANKRTNWLLPLAIGAGCLFGGAGLGYLLRPAAAVVASQPQNYLDLKPGVTVSDAP
jgi:hypothetical protein